MTWFGVERSKVNVIGLGSGLGRVQKYGVGSNSMIALLVFQFFILQFSV